MKRILACIMALAMLLGCSALAESTLNVTGSGTVYYDLYIDGEFLETKKVVFSS